MAEDAVESAGAKAPAITISTQQIIAGEGVLMPDEQCPAVHPKLGLVCDRKVLDCWGIDHICTRENGLGEFWRNERVLSVTSLDLSHAPPADRCEALASRLAEASHLIATRQFLSVTFFAYYF
jgi:hypothetical protein